MKNNYVTIIHKNLEKLFVHDISNRADAMGAIYQNGAILMPAFGGECRYTVENIFLDGDLESGATGIILTLYALYAAEAAMQMEPWISYREIPDTTPYQGAFRNRTETALIKHVESIAANQEKIVSRLQGSDKPAVITRRFRFHC